MKPFGRYGAVAGIAFTILGVANARAAPCTTTTLNVYDAVGFSCTINDKLFSGFSYVNTVLGGATPVPDTAVTVLPLPLVDDPGISFISSWNATAGQANDAAILFTVTTLGLPITDALLQLTGAVIGTGTVLLGETLSNGAALSAAIPGALTDSTTFAGVTSLLVTKDLAVVGNTGTASASILLQRFSEVPEPAGLAVIGLGLLGLAVARRRPAKG